jgi:hypothetical protein
MNELGSKSVTDRLLMLGAKKGSREVDETGFWPCGWGKEDFNFFEAEIERRSTD